MAGLREIALGIASALQSPHVPEPLPVAFWSESPEHSVELLALVVRECRDAGIPLRLVEMDPAIACLVRRGQLALAVPIVANPTLCDEARFYRRPVSG